MDIDVEECPFCYSPLNPNKPLTTKLCPYCRNKIDDVAIEGYVNFNCNAQKQGDYYMTFGARPLNLNYHVKCLHCNGIIDHELPDIYAMLQHRFMSTFKIGDM